ncbi:hypothetical protein ACFL1R_11560 [Candidatus Latescibacterota bacterium]
MQTLQAKKTGFKALKDNLPEAMNVIVSDSLNEQDLCEMRLSKMTNHDLFKMLCLHGIPRNTGRMQDYERAKEVVFWNYQFQTPGLSEKLNYWITQYIRV